jgi:hypothetical protein
VPQGSDYKAAAVKDARLVDVLTESFAGELSTVLDLLKTRIRFLVRKLQASNGRVVANQTNLALALRLRSDLIAALEQAGYGRLALKAVDEPLDRLAASVLKGASDRVALGAYDVDAIAAMKELRLAQLLNIGEDVAVQLWRVTLDGVLGTRPLLDLVDDIADVLDLSAKQARTIYDTLASTFSRQVAQIGTTGEPDEAFLYVGPDDDKTRDFCAERVDKVFSRKAIEDMDNGQLPNPMLTGGGYNCRHQFRRVSKLDVELLALMDTDERYQDRKVAA